MYRNILALILLAVCLAERLKQTREAQGLTLRMRSDLLVKVARALKVGTDFYWARLKRNNRMEFLPYDPGKLPTAPAPKPGESIKIEVKGLPPYKDYRFSLRNPKHKNYSAFVALRKAATKAMKGRAWYHGPIRMFVDIKTPNREEMTDTLAYVAGIMDTLNGFSGPNFTYLPIVYEDDHQVYRSGRKTIETDDEPSYTVHITFE